MDYERIIAKGKKYTKHERYPNTDSIIICDKCKRQDISKCIGYQQWDLCLECVKVIKGGAKNNIKTRMLQAQFRKSSRK